jgi:hypothetical protein
MADIGTLWMVAAMCTHAQYMGTLKRHARSIPTVRCSLRAGVAGRVQRADRRTTSGCAHDAARGCHLSSRASAASCHTAGRGADECLRGSADERSCRAADSGGHACRGGTSFG